MTDIENYSKEYYQANKTYFARYMKDYYQANKDSYLRKINCTVCGKHMSKTNLRRHQKSHLCVPPEQQQKFFIPDIPKQPVQKTVQEEQDVE